MKSYLKQLGFCVVDWTGYKNSFHSQADFCSELTDTNIKRHSQKTELETQTDICAIQIENEKPLLGQGHD